MRSAFDRSESFQLVPYFGSRLAEALESHDRAEEAIIVRQQIRIREEELRTKYQ